MIEKTNRQIDAEIAEKVLGWGRIEWVHGVTPMGQSPQNPLRLVLDEVPYYSTRIEDAWLVVEYLRDQWTAATAHTTAINQDFDRPFNDTVFFEMLHRHADRRWPWAFLYITPLAICEAALEMLPRDNDGDEVW